MRPTGRTFGGRDEDNWAGSVDFTGVVRSHVPDPDVAARQLCRTIGSSDEYVDVHCSVLHPSHSSKFTRSWFRLGLIDFEVAHFVPTQFNKLEFFVSLRRMDTTVDRASMIERQLASVPQAARPTEQWASVIDRSDRAPIFMGLSYRERVLIAAKRRNLQNLRSISR
jgi:hypothetical protein